MSINHDLIIEIKSQWRPEDHRCGRLISSWGIIQHYCVGLSNCKAISWGGSWFTPGYLTIHDFGPEWSLLGAWEFQRELVLDNLIASVWEFHERWNYWPGWNCEHWARLVTQGNPVCLQLASVPGLRYRKSSIPKLKKWFLPTATYSEWPGRR